MTSCCRDPTGFVLNYRVSDGYVNRAASRNGKPRKPFCIMSRSTDSFTPSPSNSLSDYNELTGTDNQRSLFRLYSEPTYRALYTEKPERLERIQTPFS